MVLEQKLQLKLAQRLVMTPSLQQAIKLLQLSRIELEQTLAQEILENPVLEVEEQEEDLQSEQQTSEKAGVEPEGEVAAAAQEAEAAVEETLPSAEDTYADIDVEAFFSDYLGDGISDASFLSGGRGEQAPLENVVSVSGGLYDHLLWQLHLASCPDVLLPVCEFIIGNLDEDGFLRASDDEIVEATGIDPLGLAEALQIVRSLDPPGIGTRTLQECLLVELDALEQEDGGQTELFDRARTVISGYWERLLHQRWELIAQDLGCPLADLKPVLEIVQRLEPKPGRVYRQDRNVYIEPDVDVRKVGDEYVISLNDDGLPRLRISRRYSRMLEARDLDQKAASFLREKMRNALWLMKSIDQRQRTIFKVAESIVAFQKEFLDRGLEYLRPMVLRQVADDIGMHESTISRVVSNKYIFTPRGLFPMKFFFHSGVDSARGENVSSLVVKERIRKLVESEDSERPLSDSKIMKMLQREGIRLARRTVAKYREELVIPSSEKRRRVF